MRYGFGAFELFPSRRLLLASGTPVRLGARAFDLLVVLAERSGEVVSKVELLDRVWPNVVVEEVALRVHLSALRKVLQEGGLGSTPISNVSGRGYTLTVPVTSSAQASEAKLAGHDLARFRLPSTGKRLFGRDEIADLLKEKLRRSGFVSVVGPGGIGKTSAALLFAETTADDYPDGLIFVDLSVLTDPDVLWSAVAGAAGLAADTEDPGQAVLARFAGKRLLLILDNCEHLVDAAASAVSVLRATLPMLHVLATSREPLRADGEWIHRLTPLECPAQHAAADAVRACSAIQLLVDRATARHDEFALRDEDLPIATELCRRLDGIPLAIELAASSIETFGLRSVAHRLDDWFLATFRGPRTATSRHQTLTATLDWSFDVLPERERNALVRLSIFRGSIDLEMAMGVFKGSDPTSIASLEAIQHLHEKSLLAADLTGHDIEYRLLETTRSYALEKLRASGGFELTARSHAEVLSDLFARADLEWDVPPRSAWVERYGRRLVDLRSALDWACSDTGDFRIASRLLCDGAPLWVELGLTAELRDRVAVLLERRDHVDALPALSALRLKILWAQTAWATQGPSPSMLAMSDECLELAERLDAPVQKMQACWLLWNRGSSSDGFDSGLTARIIDQTEHSQDPNIQLAGMRITALTFHYQGNQSLAWRYQERMDLFDELTFHKVRRIAHLGDQRLGHFTLATRLLWMRGFPDQAVAVARRGVEYAESLTGIGPLSYFLGFAACPVALWIGDVTLAREWVHRLVGVSTDYSFSFWQALGEMYHRIIPHLQEFEEEPGSALPPDADRRHLFNQLQLYCTFSPAFAAPSILASAAKPGIGWALPEVLRAKALTSNASDAERLLREAMAVAQEQGAPSWELRSAIGLARLMQRGGRANDASQALRSVLDRFSEGFQTRDLTIATQLLRDLPRA